MIQVYQIYFDDVTKQQLEPEFIPYFNDKKDGYFENTIIRNIYEQNIQTDYIGVSSWKQKRKTILTGAEIMNFIQKDIDVGKEKDVYLYPPVYNCITTYDNITAEGYDLKGIIKAPDIWFQHKAMSKVYDADVLLNNSGILPFNIFDGKWIFSHCNYWIAKKKVFDEYCEKVLIPSINFFERADIKLMAQSASWYTHSHEGKKYPSYSFVMEGLFGAFLAHSDYTYSYIYKKRLSGRRKRYKIVNVTGYERTENYV